MESKYRHGLLKTSSYHVDRLPGSFPPLFPFPPVQRPLPYPPERPPTLPRTSLHHLPATIPGSAVFLPSLPRMVVRNRALGTVCQLEALRLAPWSSPTRSGWTGSCCASGAAGRIRRGARAAPARATTHHDELPKDHRPRSTDTRNGHPSPVLCSLSLDLILFMCCEGMQLFRVPRVPDAGAAGTRSLRLRAGRADGKGAVHGPALQSLQGKSTTNAYMV